MTKAKFIKGNQYSLDDFYGFQAYVYDYFTPIDDDSLGAEQWLCIKSFEIIIKVKELK